MAIWWKLQKFSIATVFMSINFGSLTSVISEIVLLFFPHILIHDVGHANKELASLETSSEWLRKGKVCVKGIEDKE